MSIPTGKHAKLKQDLRASRFYLPLIPPKTGVCQQWERRQPRGESPLNQTHRSGRRILVEKTDRLLHQNILKVFLGYLLPTVMGMITHSLYCLADVMFIGVYVGSTALAANEHLHAYLHSIYIHWVAHRRGCFYHHMVKLGQGDHRKAQIRFSPWLF